MGNPEAVFFDAGSFLIFLGSHLRFESEKPHKGWQHGGAPGLSILPEGMQAAEGALGYPSMHTSSPPFRRIEPLFNTYP
eukprot:1146847-Pelagomonas_calceolata.AAC.5